MVMPLSTELGFTKPAGLTTEQILLQCLTGIDDEEVLMSSFELRHVRQQAKNILCKTK